MGDDDLDLILFSLVAFFELLEKKVWASVEVINGGELLVAIGFYHVKESRK